MPSSNDTDMYAEISRLESHIPQLMRARDATIGQLRDSDLNGLEREAALKKLHDLEESLARISTLRRDVARREGVIQMFKGIGIALLGALATGGGYLLADLGGVVLVFWGAIAFGLVTALLGLVQVMRNK